MAVELVDAEALVTPPDRPGVEPNVFDWEIANLGYDRFHELTPQQVPLLSVVQIASIPDGSWVERWPMANRASLTLPQVQALNTRTISIGLLPLTQKLWLTSEQIQAIDHLNYAFLEASQVPSLSPAQIAAIPNTDWFQQWPAANLAALTQTQVQALNTTTVSISLLPLTQKLWLTPAQIQAIDRLNFIYLEASQVPSLSPAQIATIPNTDWFQQWPAANRAALTQTQVQALNTATVSISLLPLTQKLWLTPAQIQAIDRLSFVYLEASQVPSLSSAQIASIPNTAWFDQWPAANRAALTQTQIQSLPIPAISISRLTTQQKLWLSIAQIQAAPLTELKLLEASQVPSLSLAQIGSVPDTSTFMQWPAANRLALTMEQVRALKFPGVSISVLSAQQKQWLTADLIHSLQLGDIALLLDDQIPLVSPEQFGQMQDLFFINGFSDRVKANLTREQLMGLPFNVLSTLMLVELPQYPPTNYVPAIHHHDLVDPPTPGTLAAFAYDITKLQDATDVAIADGDWTNPAIWSRGVVPGANAKVYIGQGRTVRFNAQMTTAIKTLRIDGALEFATNLNTTMRVDTIVVSLAGSLHIGTQTAPIADNVVAKVIIPDGGPIDTTWDPGLASRGLISRGEVRMYGRYVTPYATLAVDPMAGATALQLTQSPVGWRVGDQLVLAGTTTINADFGSERVVITGINGATVSLNRPLTYSHDAPDGMGLTVQVANLNRNIQFLAEEQVNAQERPHIAFADNPDAWVENVLVQGFGRTDKTQLVTDPVVVNGVLQSGGENARARYALHFHHTGVDPMMAPGILRGNVVVGSPGWGYVNHQGNVLMENNVAVDVVGAGFVAEDGNEIGVMRGNLVLNATGSAGGGPLSRNLQHDFGHNGHGFWLQGPGIEIIDNIVSGTRSGAYSYFTSSSKSMFDALNLSDPSIAMGHDAIPVGAVPIKRFEGNTAYGVNIGLEIWFNQTSLTDGEAFIDDFTVWNTRFGIQMFYSGHITVRNAKLFGRMDLIGDPLVASPQGVGTNRGVHDIKFDNLRMEGFVDGMIVPQRRATTIEGGRFANVRNLSIGKGQDTIRSVHITEPIAFIPLTVAQIAGRPAYDVSVTQKLAFVDNLGRKVDSLFSADDLSMKRADGSTVGLYFTDQAPNVVPFPTASYAQVAGFPAEYAGKTNLQLSTTYGLWFNGGDLPAGAFTPAGFVGLAALQALSLPADFDGDGDVDGADFLAWQRGLGTVSGAQRSQGDANADGDVDRDDLAAWKLQFGHAQSAAAVSAVSVLASELISTSPAANAEMAPPTVQRTTDREAVLTPQGLPILDSAPFSFRPAGKSRLRSPQR